MNWLSEDPFWPLALAGCALVIILLIMFATGRWALWKPAAGVIALTLVVIVVERFVVTDRERIEVVIDRAVQAANRNDLPAIEALVQPQATDLRRRIRLELGRWKIEQLRITHQVVNVNHDGVPPTAAVDLIVRMAVHQGRGGAEDLPPVAVNVLLEKVGDAWLVSAAQAEDLRSALGSKPH